MTDDQLDRAYVAMVDATIGYLRARVAHCEQSHRDMLASSPEPPKWALQMPRYTVFTEDDLLDDHGYWTPAEMMQERLEEIWRVAWAWGHAVGKGGLRG